MRYARGLVAHCRLTWKCSSLLVRGYTLSVRKQGEEIPSVL